MRTEILHILNGDATLNVFNKANIAGDTLVWREILADGPVSKTNLWETREKWICENYGESAEGFKKKVVAEAERFNDLNKYKEIVLWFEYDLTCQINLIYILSVLRKSSIPTFLICPSRIEGLPNFRGLGELSSTHLQRLLPTKTKLQQQDFDLANKAWDLYIENNPLKIASFLNIDFGNLSLLKKALEALLSRFPKTNGLNYIDEVLLSLIDKGITIKSKIFEAFWAQESIFGLTNLQLDLALTKLHEKELIKCTTNNCTRLN